MDALVAFLKDRLAEHESASVLILAHQLDWATTLRETPDGWTPETCPSSPRPIVDQVRACVRSSCSSPMVEEESRLTDVAVGYLPNRNP